MTDPLGLVGNLQGIDRSLAARPTNAPPQDGPGFKELLTTQIEQVNALQKDAEAAVEDLASGQRDDLEGVLLATQKADTAFRMLLQVRNKMMEAYEEVKQIRV